MGSAAGAGLVQILTESDISDPMQPVLNGPMTFGPSGQFGAQGGLVADGEQVRVLGLEVAVEALDPGLIGGVRRCSTFRPGSLSDQTSC